MSREIATWSMIRSKISSFPTPTSGRENECLTKAEILATGVAKVNGSYGDNECVVIDDIELGYIYPLETNFTMIDYNKVTVNLSGYVSKVTIVWLGGVDYGGMVNHVINVGDNEVPSAGGLTYSFTGTALLVYPRNIDSGTVIIKINIEGREYSLNIERII